MVYNMNLKIMLFINIIFKFIEEVMMYNDLSTRYGI